MSNMNFIRSSLIIFANTLKKTFEFKNRSNRKEFINFFLLWFLIEFILSQLNLNIVNILNISFLIVSQALAVRRLHDINISGLYILLFIPIIFITFSNNYIFTCIGIFMGLGFNLILFFLKGTSGTNKYGEEPVN